MADEITCCIEHYRRMKMLQSYVAPLQAFTEHPLVQTVQTDTSSWPSRAFILNVAQNSLGYARHGTPDADGLLSVHDRTWVKLQADNLKLKCRLLRTRVKLAIM